MIDLDLLGDLLDPLIDLDDFLTGSDRPSRHPERPHFITLGLSTPPVEDIERKAWRLSLDAVRAFAAGLCGLAQTFWQQAVVEYFKELTRWR